MQQQSKLSRDLHSKLSFIHAALLKLGCPLISTGVHTKEQLQQKLSIFFTASDSRLELIQWLIAVIYPGYKLDPEYRNTYDDDPYIHRVKKYKVILWQIGVMPMSKHTKNLDYDKYVEGLLGYESSVGLIYSLTELADEKFAPGIHKIEEVAADLLGELIEHNGELVNPNYDPYGVTFPPKYFQDEENDQEANEKYEQMMKQLQQWDQSKVESKGQETSKLFADADTYRELFARKYQKLGKAIESFTESYEKVVPMEDTKQLHQRRILNLSKPLCKLYRQYKKTIGEIKEQQFKGNLKGLKEEVAMVIKSLNEIHSL